MSTLAARAGAWWSTLPRKTRRRVGIAAVGTLLLGPGLGHWAQLSWQERLMNRRLRELELIRKTLTEEYDRLSSDPVYMEGLVRSTFKVAKPGELVVPLEASTKSSSPR